MAIAEVNHALAVSSGGTTATAGPLNTLSCDFMVAGLEYYNGASPTITFTDTDGNTWTKVTRTTPFCGTDLYYCVPTIKSASNSFVATPIGLFYACLEVVIFSGVHQSNPLVLNSAADTTGGTSIQTLGGVPSEDNCLCLSIGTTSDTGTLACDIGAIQYISQFNGGVSVPGGLIYSIQTTATSFQPTWSWPASGQGTMRTSFFRAAAVSSNPYLLVKN